MAAASDHESRGLAPPPRLGRALRLAYESLRERVVQALHDAGFPDITQTELGVFHSSGPERARPIDLAQRCHMTKQAMNYVLARMEQSGYLERRGGTHGENRLVHLTPRGWKVLEVIRKTIDATEAEWRSKIGRQRFDPFLRVLEQIITSEGEAQAHRDSATVRLRRRRPQAARRRLRRASA